MINITAIGPTDEPPLTEVKWTKTEDAQYYACDFRVTRTFILRRVCKKFDLNFVVSLERKKW